MTDKNINRIFGALMVILVAIAGYFCIKVIIEQPLEQPLEGISSIEASQSTSTAAMEGGAAFSSEQIREIATTTPLGVAPSGDARVGAVILDSVVITSSTPYSLIIKNATSTTDISSTTVAVINNNSSDAVAGTYPLGIVLDRGLILQFESGFYGSYVISWK
uniref:Uncharacterized protein n=1 Tax=viral metagenome TaxID=1070528 RepID=A0A6H1ZSI8_9ZZZZ